MEEERSLMLGVASHFLLLYSLLHLPKWGAMLYIVFCDGFPLKFYRRFFNKYFFAVCTRFAMLVILVLLEQNNSEV